MDIVHLNGVRLLIAIRQNDAEEMLRLFKSTKGLQAIIYFESVFSSKSFELTRALILWTVKDESLHTKALKAWISFLKRKMNMDLFFLSELEYCVNVYEKLWSLFISRLPIDSYYESTMIVKATHMAILLLMNRQNSPPDISIMRTTNKKLFWQYANAPSVDEILQKKKRRS